MTDAAGDAFVKIVLTCRDDVVAGGVRRESWRVKYNDGWLSIGSCLQRGLARRIPSSRALPAGCQSLLRVELSVAPGTLFERRLSVPAPARARGIDAYLRGGSGSGARSLASLFRADQSGRLIAETEQR